MPHSHYSQLGYGYWWEAPVFHIGLFRALMLESSHDMAASICTGVDPGEQGGSHCALHNLGSDITYSTVTSTVSHWSPRSTQFILWGNSWGHKREARVTGSYLEAAYIVPQWSMFLSQPLPKSSESHPVTAAVWNLGSCHLTQVQAQMSLLGSSSSNKMISLNLKTWELETGYSFPSTNPRYGGWDRYRIPAVYMQF